MTREASRTALLVAAYRGRASRRSVRICDDPWADALAGEEGRAIAARYDLANPHMELWIGVRTRILDDTVREALDHGFTQVVVLGAGLDTRAARLARPGVSFFEVDQPGSQSEKRARVAALPGYPTGAAVYVTCDFEHEDFLDRLVASGFRRDAASVMLWEGVVYYLPEPAVRATAQRVAQGCDPRSVLLFDYVPRAMVDGGRLKARDREMRDIVADLGEPIRFGINDPLPMLFEAGFRHVRKVSFDEACLSITGSYDRERAFRFQHIALASRTAPRGVWSW